MPSKMFAALPGPPAPLYTGYRTVRPLSSEHEAAVADFVAPRRLQLALWMVQERDQPMFRDDWRIRVERTLNALAAT